MAKVKGIDLLIEQLAQEECPTDYGMEEKNRKMDDNGFRCIYGDYHYKEKCIECFKQAIELEYESEEE